MTKKIINGIIVSDKMKKTVVVKVGRIKEHPKYKKRFRVYKKYKAHDEKEEYHVGDRVLIEECRPLSKEKRWRVIGKVKEEDVKMKGKRGVESVEDNVENKGEKPE